MDTVDTIDRNSLLNGKSVDRRTPHVQAATKSRWFKSSIAHHVVRPAPALRSKERLMLNIDEAGKHTHELTRLPHNRLADGTVHRW
jgi:hypothetical protein